MLWNRRTACVAAFLLAAFLLPYLAEAREVCTEGGHGKLISVDVFDGNPSDLADLMAEETSKTSGYFELGHIYTAGRHVTIRCDYADGTKREEILHTPVKTCTYHYAADSSLSLVCR